MKFRKEKSVHCRVDKFIGMDRGGKARILLKDIFVNGAEFRDHCWIDVDKRTKYLNSGDTIMAFARIKKYTANGIEKRTLRGFRCIEINSSRFIAQETKAIG